jgi:hypothetical protein
MEHHTRHLVSQHFGRVVAHVDFDAYRNGIVHLSLERPHRLAVQFTFSAETAARIFSDARSWKEMVVRLAVAQAHKLHFKDQISVAWQAEPLNLNGQPWLGDLLLAPYGGATHGLDPAVRQSLHGGHDHTQIWPGFSARLKMALHDVGCHAGPRTLCREFNARTTRARLTARVARQWLRGLATPAPEQLAVLAAWLGVGADWLRRGQSDGATHSKPELKQAGGGASAGTLETPSKSYGWDRRHAPRRSRRVDRHSASLIDKAVELQRAQGDQSASAFLSKHSISGHIVLRVLACAAFRRKPDCNDPISIAAPPSRAHERQQK